MVLSVLAAVPFPHEKIPHRFFMFLLAVQYEEGIPPFRLITPKLRAWSVCCGSGRMVHDQTETPTEKHFLWKEGAITSNCL